MLGVDKKRIEVTGNMKYDVTKDAPEPDTLRSSLEIGQDKKIFTAGSTHKGEDEVIIKAYLKMLKAFPDLYLLIAPRHIERTDEIERIASQYNLRSRRFSSHRKTPPDCKIIILDIMGKLKALYAVSDIVFIGGSLIPKCGGHNLLEPAEFKKPILIGPYMDNFKDIADEFLKKAAAITVRDDEELRITCEELLLSPSKAREIGQVAFSIIEKNRGVAERNFRHIENMLTKEGNA